MTHCVTPRTTLRWAVRTMLVTGPLSLLVLVFWFTDVIPDGRSTGTLMVYNALLLITVGAGCVAAVAGVQVAIHQAFSAGFQTGQASVDCGDGDPLLQAQRRGDKDQDALLRLVD